MSPKQVGTDIMCKKLMNWFLKKNKDFRNFSSKVYDKNFVPACTKVKNQVTKLKVIKKDKVTKFIF